MGMLNGTEMRVTLTRGQVNDLMLSTVLSAASSRDGGKKWLELHEVLCDQLKAKEEKHIGVYTYKVEYFSKEKQETREEFIEVNSYLFPDEVWDRDAEAIQTALNRAKENRECGEAVTSVTLMSIE